MAEEDVWAADSAEPALGTGAYGEGLSINETFSIDAVFKNGVAFVQEQPMVALLGGANLFVLQLLLGFVAMGASIAVTTASIASDIDPDAQQALSQLVSTSVNLLGLPFQQLVMAGLMVAAANWFRADEASIGALYTSLRPAVRALLASLVAGFAMFAAAMVLLVPGIAVGAVLASQDMTMPGLVVGGLLVFAALPVIIYISLGLMLAPYAAVLDDLGPIEAVAQAWAAARGARVTLFVTNFVFGILAGLSACMCSIPLIVVVPVQVGGMVAGWLRYARPEGDTGSWPFFTRNL